MRSDPELADALRKVVDKIDASVREAGYAGEAVRMYLAGGLAAHYYSRSRHTFDIDASFSHRLILPYKELLAEFVAGGKRQLLHFDTNYNPAFALMHPDYESDAREWPGLGNEKRIVKLYVLSPVDLAVSKVSRYSEQDRKDIQELARTGLIDAARFRTRAMEALEYYIGNKATLLANLETACQDILKYTPGEKPAQSAGIPPRI